MMNAEVVGVQQVGFKRHLHVEIRDGEGAFLFSERGVTALRGPGVDVLAARLDGTRDLATLLRTRPAGMESEQVAGLIAQLVEAGLVGFRPSGAPRTDDPQLAYWDACGAAPEMADRRDLPVNLITTGAAADVAELEPTLRAAGLTAVGRPGPAPAPSTELSIVICDDYLDPALADVDAEHREAGVPWLLAKPLGVQVWLGPVFQPDSSACWHCMAIRLRQHRYAEAQVQAELGKVGPGARPVTSVQALMAAATNLIALEATKWLSGLRRPSQQCVWTFDSADLDGRHHAVRRRPQCAQCGDPGVVAKQAERPVTLRPTTTVSYLGGGQRTLSPEQVMETYGHLISPVSGIVKELTPDGRGPSMFHSWRSGPNIGRRTAGINALRRTIREHSGGKGKTAVEARVGALCEAIERYSGTFHGDEARVRGSLASLGERAVHPNACTLFADRQYEERADWNASHGPFQFICERFDEQAAMDWTPVWSLTSRTHRLLPTAMLYFGTPAGRAARGMSVDSNGNAAGTSIEDAVLQGLFELIERDSVALWWYNRTRYRGVDLAAVDDPWVAQVRGQYAELGRELWVLDLTSDIGVPVMAAISRRLDGPREDIMLGFGAHLDTSVALTRALTELNQLMPNASALDIGAIDDPDAAAWWSTATVRNQPYLLPDDGLPRSVPRHIEYPPKKDLSRDIEMITARLDALGMETLVLDQTRPDIELPVVKVIVPGLRHFWARFGPGRLYDVPVKLGKRSEPIRYEDLNPMPLFL